jgi:hypothetical protein
MDLFRSSTSALSANRPATAHIANPPSAGIWRNARDGASPPIAKAVGDRSLVEKLSVLPEGSSEKLDIVFH